MRWWRRCVSSVVVVVTLSAASEVAFGGVLYDWQMISGGGGVVSQGSIELTNTIGSTVSGSSSGGGFTLVGDSLPAVEEASCEGDVNGNGSVDVGDLVEIVLAWGTNDADADVDGSGTVDVGDLVALILAWGPCP